MTATEGFVFMARMLLDAERSAAVTASPLWAIDPAATLAVALVAAARAGEVDFAYIRKDFAAAAAESPHLAPWFERAEAAAAGGKA